MNGESIPSDSSQDRSTSLTMSHLRHCMTELSSIASQYYNLDFSQTPLLKPILLLTGSQSAGKSAIINYLYSMALRQVGEQAIDDKFTVIECLSESEFAEIVGKEYKPRSFDSKKPSDLHWLMKPRTDDGRDERDGIVWHKLDNLRLMQRYKQFYENSELGEILRTQNILQGIVVNEKYVQCTELYPCSSPIVRDVIIIDTPGFNDESIGTLAKFKAYIRLFEFFYEQSQYCFFITDPSRLRSIGNALHILELTIADKEVKHKVFEMVTREVNKTGSSQKDSSSTSPSQGISFSFSNFVVDVAANALQRTIPYFSQKNEDEVEKKFTPIGSSMYEKLYFVINKADKVRNLYYAYFEFGLSLGRYFQHFPLPHANRILAIALPMEQRALHNRYGYDEHRHIDDYRIYEKMFESMIEERTNRIREIQSKRDEESNESSNGNSHRGKKDAKNGNGHNNENQTIKYKGNINESHKINVAQLGEFESILFSLRGDDTKKRCLLLYIDFIFKSILNAREAETNRFSRAFRKLKHYYNEPWSRAKDIYKGVMKDQNGLVPQSSFKE